MNVEMSDTMMLQVGINCFPMVMLLIILLNNNMRTARVSDRRYFNILTGFSIGLLVFDVYRYGLDGISDTRYQSVLWYMHFFYLICMVSMACAWMIYAASRLNVFGSWRRRIGISVSMAAVSLIHTVIAIISRKTGALYVVTEDGKYKYGDRYGITYLICLSLLVINMVMVAYKWYTEGSKEQKKECALLFVSSIPPVASFVIQHFIGDLPGSAAMVALSILFLYLNTQNRQITTDALTGLNNRMEFDKYILKKSEQQNSITDWGLFVLDVDEFKRINDTFGHTVGDEALWETADILRHTLGNDKTFIARYGGDEFVVVGDWESEQIAKAAIARVEKNVVHFNQKASKEYKLSFSIGYSMWNETGTVKSLIEKADERMYAIKMQKKLKR